PLCRWDPDTNEIRRQVRELIGAPFRRQSIFEDDAAPFDVAEVAESRSARFHASQRRRAGEEEADPWGAARALRFSGERRKRETESENDREPDPPHGHLVEMAGGSLAEDGESQERVQDRRKEAA